jgi:hypothetical protein
LNRNDAAATLVHSLVVEVVYRGDKLDDRSRIVAAAAHLLSNHTIIILQQQSIVKKQFYIDDYLQ